MNLKLPYFKRCSILLLLLFVVMAITNSSYAQQRVVTGTVTTSTDQMGLPGVNILLKGTSTGAVTDIDGKYSISISESGGILVFSMIGFESIEEVVGNRSEINLVMQEDIAGLDEVVVVGYGTQVKRNITGSIASADLSRNSDDISVTEAMVGVPGVQFTDTGRPGQVGNILIRGQNSLSGSNSPLIVLDGIIFSGNLNDISPRDIKSMEILKDASSTAIYGSRAANGVILITSKGGTTETPSISINTYTGISEWASELKLLSPDRYIQRRLDWRAQSGLESDPNNISKYISTTEAENLQNGKSIDPWKEISQQGRTSAIDLNISGRTKATNYFISTSLSDDKGLIYNDNQKRSTFRANITSTIKPWLQIGTNTMFSHRDLSGVSANLRDAYRISPYGTMYYEDGSPTQYPVPDEQAAGNPMRTSLLSDNEEIRENLFSNFFAQVDAPFLDGLSYRVNFSPSFQWNHEYNFMHQDKNVSFNSTSATKLNERQYNWVLENIVTYNKSIGEEHNFDVTLLFGRNHVEAESTIASGEQFNVDVLGYNNLGLGEIQRINSSAYAVDMVSYMARMNYQFKNRYLLTLTARKDGSSVFSVNNKYATFPSGSLAWIMTDEAFMQNLGFLDMLKLRASYGAVGNQAIEPYQSLTLSSTRRYVYGDGGSSSLGVVTATLGNDDLTWETTKTANFAMDFELFQRRIAGTIEFYSSDTENLLVRRNIPVMNGYTSILTNVGEVNNKGIEVSLSTDNIRKAQFQWSTDFTFSHNKNEIVHLFKTDLDRDGKEDDNIANGWFIGKPINSYYDYAFDGIYQLGDDDIPAGSKPGFVRVQDLNGDGIINTDDRTVVGSGNIPKYQFGLRNNFSYNNFSLSIFVNAMQGWIAPFNLINPLVPGRSLGQLDAGWWTPENQSNSRPSLIYSNPLQTNWYDSRDFIRLREVTFSYDLSQPMLDKFKLKGLKVYMTGKNLGTITDWMGTDPENGGAYTSEQGSDNLYPMPKTFLVGLNVSF
ncbi:TonB-linked SusC/RagA family outer membrane protein [Algoriphagus ratkowskyi]|uniref:TonB-dependent receptor n=1 Tax=Algoriphagus ratkowskyi TaxID=57028 RepID=A0A2W7R1F7_9BACT|nr:TonB-dependent receptor [Algoriphagus ratkowskyi]PZX53076.1 TonB-linked SusC/RagA family outer membrane protein [Algoriphagus ratkowskyi]TXD76356.1 TonB-dependent receptor [Algoriphagus ratkowskyi]